MPKTVEMTCLDCGERAPFAPMQLACAHCGSEWLEARYDYAAVVTRFAAPDSGAHLRRNPGLWRYHELLPLRDLAHAVTLGEGNTPLIPLPNLGLMLGCANLFVKDERQNPSGSFKDRQAALAVSVMKEADIREAVVASTGNVAISYAAYGARAGIKVYAFLTSLVPPEKMRECALYGAQVIKVTTTYDRSKELAQAFARQRGMYYDRGLRSIASVESMKTLAYEIAEQLARLNPDGSASWRAPDWYVQSISGGLGPVGAMKGFRELQTMGLIDRLPRLACIQVEGCAPMVTAYRRDSETPDVVVSPRTHIGTLATGNPGRAYRILRNYLQQHGGTMESVSDEETFRAMHVMAKIEGLSMEPGAAAAFAGLFKLVRHGLIHPDETVVINCTGHTFPVESEVLGDGWAQELGEAQLAQPEPEGVLAALQRLDARVRSIAIIDDTPDTVRLLRRILQARGNYDIHEAEDGRAGLALIRERRPDLVILDLMMPEVDGFAVLDALRADEATRDIPVIVVTAKALTPEERARLDGQTSSLLQKGEFTDDELLDDVRKALPE
ncbi:MAG: pyridoxal-phosphate dependent enzyme [Anaerolineales bacterium]|nr:pyridoxal-phosphate dependent enzyme [Anaerolineales bacterium]